MNIVKNLVPESKYSIKCPYAMTPTRIVVHNTANDASAKNEVAYMKRNNNQVSFHYAVDDKEVVQGIPENRNAWHSGDGGNGKGNREGIAIEICYSKSGGTKFSKAEENAAELIADILKRYGWGIDKVTKHQDYNGKYCPHRTLDLGWERFINMIDMKLNPNVVLSKSIGAVAEEVIKGLWGNGTDRKKRLTNAGYDYAQVQAAVNAIVKGQTKVATSTVSKKENVKKSNEEIAKEVIAGKWGNGAVRKKKLKDAGYNYSAIQKIVNKLLK
ncbi:MAG: N-acetylmuramoyl-L-alanine amidase [Clostridia bacterium]|nr:N-acetylmuramoyl-L-alanine amidase [Clostridia bacterium]